jgi:ssDNA-binding Zn-finger/Zn-ribbon topoisomerase 1
MPIDPRTLKGYNGPGGGRHRPCAGCGYDLFGLATDGVCPECGLGYGRMAEHNAKAPSRRSPASGPVGPVGPVAVPAGPGTLRPSTPHAGGVFLEGATCPSCGYGLGGLKVGCKCPECGKAAGEPEPASSGATAADGPPACLACGYDLSGIVPGSVCPECGTPSAAGAGQLRGADGRSRRHNHTVLMDLPVATLMSLRFRVRLLCLAWMGWMLAWLGVWLSVAAVAWLQVTPNAIAIMLLGAGLAGVGASAAQWWAIGGAATHGVGSLLGQPQRRRVRAIIAPCVWTFLALTIFVSMRMGGGGALWGFIVQLVAYPIAVAGGVALAAVLPLHAELARLLQDDQATNRLTGLTWGLLLAVIFGCFMVMLVMYMPSVPVLGLGSQLVCTIITAIAPVLWFGALIDIARGFSWAVHNRQSQLEREARWVARSAERGQAERQRDARAFGRDPG